MNKRLTLGAVPLIIALALIVSSSALGSPSARSASMSQAKAETSKKHKKKKKKKKKKVPVAPAPVAPPQAPPTPAALTDAEVIQQVSQKANEYCLSDPDCFDAGYYYSGDTSHAFCDSKSTYEWACYGWNDEDNGVDPVFTCDFREIVDRVGTNSITSHQDLVYGWSCA